MDQLATPAVSVTRRIVVGVLVAALTSAAVTADDTPLPQASPEELGLLLPAAPPLPGNSRYVLVPRPDQQPVVGLIHVEVGDRYVVLLPNGQLVAVPAATATLTDRPFEEATKAEMAEELTAGRFRGFRVRNTRRYLYVYNASEDFATATSRILETMYPGVFNYCRRQKIAVQDPQFPLVVVMFRTQEEFDQYRQMPPGLVAYYNGLSNHIVMYEQSRLAEVAPELAFKQSVSTIAHEGVHQILHNIGVQQRLSRWPLWFSEGLAEYFAPTDLKRGARWKGVGLVNDLRVYELSQYYKAQRLRGTQGQLLRKTIESSNLDSLGYATSWALVNYLARYQRESFQSYLRDVSQLGPLESLAPGSLFAEHFGDNYTQLEEALVKHLMSLPYVDPVANQTHYVLMVAGPRREVLVTSSPLKLQQYQRENVQGRAFRVQAFPNRDSAEVFARNWVK